MTHHHEAESTLSFEEKLIKLFEHWIKHNKDHAKTYRDWAEKAKENDLEKIYPILEEVAYMTEQINIKLTQTINKINS